jgi:transcription initiation factor IIF auxiliary subunit
VLKEPPFKVTRFGWGYFVIGVIIVLKEEYLWSNQSRNLELEWELDFDGLGNSTVYSHAVLLDHKSS